MHAQLHTTLKCTTHSGPKYFTSMSTTYEMSEIHTKTRLNTCEPNVSYFGTEGIYVCNCTPNMHVLDINYCLHVV